MVGLDYVWRVACGVWRVSAGAEAVRYTYGSCGVWGVACRVRLAKNAPRSGTRGVARAHGQHACSSGVGRAERGAKRWVHVVR